MVKYIYNKIINQIIALITIIKAFNKLFKDITYSNEFNNINLFKVIYYNY